MARAKVRLEMDDKGAQEILSWQSTADELIQYGNQLARVAKANSGNPDAVFSVVSLQGVATSRRHGTSRRARVHVGTANIAAMLAEAQDRALLRALNGAVGR